MKHTRIKPLLLLLAVVLWSLAPMLAQQAPQTSKVELKGKAPVSSEILKVTLPKPHKATLANGVRVVIIEDHRFPFVNASLMIEGAGPVFEPAGSPGLASLTAELMREGTKTRSSQQLAEQLDELGAMVNVSSDFGSPNATVMANGLSDNIAEWFPIVADVLLNPSFPNAELAKLKQRAKARLLQQRSTPQFLAIERFSRAVYGDHPAAVVSPTAASIDALTPEALAAWHGQHYCPQNAILGIAGDVNPAAFVAKLNQWLGNWKKTDYKPALPPNPASASARRAFLVDRPKSVQSFILLGNIAIDRRDADYFPVTLMNRIIGGGAAGRFFLNLREVHGYTYGAYSNFQATKFAGPWSGSASVRTDVTDGALTEFFNEIKRIGIEPVPGKEMDEAKRSLIASFALSLESPSRLLGYAIESELYGFPDTYWDTYPDKLMAVSAADVQRVGTKYLNPEAMQVVTVGDGTKIKSILEKYGPVETYNVDGKPATTAQPTPSN